MAANDTIKVDGLGQVPKRFGSQASLATYAESLNDEQFGVLVGVLRDRRWTQAEIDERVAPMRPGHPAVAPQD